MVNNSNNNGMNHKDQEDLAGNNVDNRKVVRNLLFVVIGMFGFGFALVPLYDVFCDITGLNGKTNSEAYVSTSTEVDISRTIRVEFLANIDTDLPWDFEPVEKTVVVHPGEATRITYIARNRTKHDIVGRAVPSIAPGQAAAYFKKTECFCFSEQTLKAGEEKEMPVVFIVDPAVDKDVHEITLSYTFFAQPGAKAAESSNLSASLTQ